MTLSKEKIEYFKKKLEGEKKHLEEDLGKIGKKNEEVPGDWEPAFFDPNLDVSSESGDMSDVYEDKEQRAVIEDNLEEQLVFVNQALERIKEGTYGICQKCGEEIDEKRLEANPTSKYCVKHSNNETF